MTTSIPFFIGKLPWQSRGVMGSLVAIVAFVLQLKGWHVDQGKLIDDLTQIIGLIGAIVGLWGRIKADQPIVWTRGTTSGGAFNPQAEVLKAEPVNPKDQSGYAYLGALCVLASCIAAAALMVACHTTADLHPVPLAKPRNPELPVVHHPSIASDLWHSLSVSPSFDVTTNRSGQSIPVVTININGGVEF